MTTNEFNALIADLEWLSGKSAVDTNWTLRNIDNARDAFNNGDINTLEDIRRNADGLLAYLMN